MPLPRSIAAILITAAAAAQTPSVGALTRQLGSNDPAERVAAARQLAELAPKSGKAREALALALADDEPAVRKRAAAAIAAGGKKALKLVTKALDDRDRCLGALETVAAMGPVALPLLPDVMALWPRFDGEHGSEISAAIVAMGPGAVSVVAKALDDHLQMTHAARVLQHFGATAGPAVPQLVEQLAHRGKNGQTQVVEALGAIGDERAIVPLIAYIEARLDAPGDDMQCIAAFRALGRFGTRAGAAVPLAVTALQLAPTATNGRVRSEAADALGHIGKNTAELRDALGKAAAGDPSSEVQSRARAALQRLQK